MKGESFLFLGGFGEGLVVGLGERAHFTLLAVLFIETYHRQSRNLYHGNQLFTNLPLGKTKVHLAAALRGKAGTFLQGTAHGASGDGQVTVVTGSGISIAL